MERPTRCGPLGPVVLWSLAAAACTVQGGVQGRYLPGGPLDCYAERGEAEEVDLDRTWVSEDGRWAMDVGDPWIYDGWLDQGDFIDTRFFADCVGDGCSDMIRIWDHTPSGDTWSKLETLLMATDFDMSEVVLGWTEQGVCYGQQTLQVNEWVLVARELLDGRGYRFHLELSQAQDAVDGEWLDLLDTFQVAWR